MGRRIGLLGGTFDPPHLGHLWLAETARTQLDLDVVLFLPVGQPPHKQDQPVTAVHHRVAMTELAIRNHPHFLLDETDVKRPCPHTTVSLLPLMRAKHPDAAFWLLVGADSLQDLPTWEDPSRLITLCRIAALPRTGTALDWDVLDTAVPGIRTVVDLLHGPQLTLSSTETRQWAALGQSVTVVVGRAASRRPETACRRAELRGETDVGGGELRRGPAGGPRCELSPQAARRGCDLRQRGMGAEARTGGAQRRGRAVCGRIGCGSQSGGASRRTPRVQPNTTAALAAGSTAQMLPQEVSGAEMRRRRLASKGRRREGSGGA